jgi:magnesium transporter
VEFATHDGSCLYPSSIPHLLNGAEIENVRLLASTLVEKETAGINRAMNILTVVSVIILPLTLITGWYGMNFQRYNPSNGEEIGFWNMPELYWPYSYPVCIGIVIAIVISLTLFFHRQGLLFRRKHLRVNDEWGG